MSMIAKFVEVAPDRFAEILEEPDSVTNLFTEQTAGGLDLMGRLAKAAARFDPAANPRMIEDAPKRLADAIERMQDPALREALAKRLGELGIRTPELRSGTQGQQVMKLMQERMAALQAKLGGGAGASPNAAPTQISLDKAWHGVHFLLCGRAEPDRDFLSQIVMGGTEIGDDEMGYGPARYFTPPDVAKAAAELAAPALEAQMQARFDPARMLSLEIYPGGWDPSTLGWLMEEYRNLRGFFAAAGAHQAAVITCLV